jgi:hypothetical protein
MVKIQIAGGYLEPVEGTNIPLNFSVQDIRDISAKSGAFSKSIELTGSRNNLELLGHLYEVNIEDATFNINTLTECSVIQNGITVVERAYLQLLSVNKQEPSTVNHEKVTFTVAVKDTAADLFTTINNRYLSEVDLTDLNHTLSATNIVNSFGNDVTDGYKYFPCYTPTNTIPVKEFKPWIYAKTYLDRIFAKAGKSYTWAGLQEARFDKLVIPYNGDGTKINVDAYKVAFNKTNTLSGTHTGGVININNTQQLTNVTETVDNASIFNPTTGQYTSPFYVSTGESINVSVSVSRLLTLTNPISTNVRIRYANTVFGVVNYTSGFAKYSASVRVFRNGLPYGTTQLMDILIQSPISSGTQTILNDSTTVNIPVTGLNQGDVITFALVINNANVQGQWRNVNTNATVNVGYNFSLTSSVTVTPSDNNIGLFGTVDMNSFIPRQIKQSDFVKAFLTMYNLVAVPDELQPDNIIFLHRDEYYDSGKEKDWSRKLANDREKQITFLPDITKKKIQISYKDDSDEVNKAYKSFTNETFGQVEYTLDNEYVRDIDRNEIVFSPTPSAVTSYGATVPMLLGSAPKTNIRVLIDNGTQSLTTPIIVQNYTGNTVTSTTYAQASHFENPSNPSFDINFGVCDYYLYSIGVVTGNNLYNLYWRRTMAQLNSGKMLTAYFDLNEADIQSLKLNDKIYCEGAWWNINRVIDYNANKSTLTKVELISIDEGIKLPQFKIRPTRPSVFLDSLPIRGNLIKKFYEVNNVIEEGGDVTGKTGLVVKGGEIVAGNIKVDSINGVVQSSDRVYKALITQSSTNAPSISQILRNDYDIVLLPEYVSTGTYKFTNFVTTSIDTYFITEDIEWIYTEDEMYLMDENSDTELLGSTTLEALHNGNLPNGNTARFSIQGNDLYLYTYSSGTLSNDVLPTDIPWVMTLTFWDK